MRAAGRQDCGDAQFQRCRANDDDEKERRDDESEKRGMEHLPIHGSRPDAWLVLMHARDEDERTRGTRGAPGLRRARERPGFKRTGQKKNWVNGIENYDGPGYNFDVRLRTKWREEELRHFSDFGADVCPFICVHNTVFLFINYFVFLDNKRLYPHILRMSTKSGTY